jgi:DNA-binding transcriptional MerR regulator/mannose-6-phosphate isomerase-like protein (cupin superfamily)
LRSPPQKTGLDRHPAKSPIKKKTAQKAFVIREALKIGTVARRLGISTSLLRAWEKLGLASPVRTGGNYRIYTDEDLRLLRRAVYFRRVRGLNAPAILDRLRQEGLLNHRSTSSAPGQPLIGAHLRKLRLQRGESLATVAEGVDVSVGFLSNLERSQSGASIGILRRLAQYYGLNILDFFGDGHAASPLIRPGERRVLKSGEGVQMELLAFGKITMEPHLFRVAPGAGSRERYSHEGEEFLFILNGRLVIFLENDEYRLRAGDSFYFDSKTPHRWHNPGKKETTILWINTPPTF